MPLIEFRTWGGSLMKFKKIRTRMLAFILPLIALGFGTLMMVSIMQCRTAIFYQVDQTMMSEIRVQEGIMKEHIGTASGMSAEIANMVAVGYTTTSWATYEEMLERLIGENEMAVGSGIWFEPHVYDGASEYYGPYVYKDGDSIVTTWDYSNAEYDYFSQEYYMLAKESEGTVLTDPYYDETSDMMMMSCTSPIIDHGKFIGCVTVDIEMGTIQDLVSEIQMGATSRAILVMADGTYLGGVEEDLIASSANLKEDKQFASVADTILKNEKGNASVGSGLKKTNVFYDTIDLTGWKLIITLSQAELNGAVTQLQSFLFGISILGLIIVAVVLIIQVNSITRSIKKVKDFSGELSEGNFGIEQIQVKDKDEIGAMSQSLNVMFTRNKSVITNIADKATNIDVASTRLHEAADKLTKQFSNIENYMDDVNRAMTSTSAATEEVNASAEEVFSNINVLAGEVENCLQMADEIQQRALEIQTNSQQSSESATELSKQFEERLHISIENAQVVSKVGEMADVISSIAEQINLLALNASIEAARAGEAGRGFAVVASEIGNLAGETATAVRSIQETIMEVQSAFDGLTSDSSGLLSFVQDTVTPDYENFVGVAKQYGADAQSFADAVGQISNMSDNIRLIMEEVTQAIQSVAESTTETTTNSNLVMETVSEVGGDVETISTMSNEQEEIAEDLNSVVSEFKL